jgi:hypothetical protein
MARKLDEAQAVRDIETELSKGAGRATRSVEDEAAEAA